MDPKSAFRYAWQPYVVAIALTAVAAALRLWPLQALGVRLAWLTFYPAVMVAALYGGFSAGLLGTFLSCLTALYVLPVFVDRPFIRDSADWLGLAVFFATSSMISGVAEAMLRARAREKQANEQLEAANRKLETANQQLEAANSELEAFSYSVSHDLRAPLRHVIGFTNLLQAGAAPTLDDKGRHYLTTISESAKRMGALIDDLLTFSRVGRAEMQPGAVNLEQTVKEALRELRQEMEGRAIVWKIAPLPEVHGDSSMLRLAWVNLIANAVKYTRTRPRAEIEIGCDSSQDNEIVFFIRDNGVGFEMRYVDKLFGVFQRLHRAGEFEGTGIGLANVRRIVHRHGGRAWAEGAVDSGAAFYFSLPKSATED